MSLIKTFFILNICEKIQQNRSINEGGRAMKMSFFSKNSYCALDLGPRMLKLELVQDIVILLICVKLNLYQFINEGTNAMTMFFYK